MEGRAFGVEDIYMAICEYVVDSRRYRESQMIELIDEIKDSDEDAIC